MKHTMPVTMILVIFFLLSQFGGLFIIDKAIDKEKSAETGVVTFEDLAYDIERPPLEQGTSYIFIIIAVLIGTIIVLLLIRFRKPKVWKIWYLFSVVFTISISLSVLIDPVIAFIVSVVTGIFKVYKPNMYLHNISELFIYSGIAVIFVPVMNIFSVVMLLIIISIYDMYAVWKSKHMVKLAEFQKDTNVFAGLSIPYTVKETKTIKPLKKTVKIESEKATTAVLGGGDIAFPLLFSGVILKTIGIFPALIVSIFTAIALSILLIQSEKGKYYPAMPFLSIGCFIGWGFILLF